MIYDFAQIVCIYWCIWMICKKQPNRSWCESVEQFGLERVSFISVLATSVVSGYPDGCRFSMRYSWSASYGGKKKRQAMNIQRSNEARSRNIYFRARETHMKHFECVSLSLVVQRVKRIRRIALSMWPIWLHHIFHIVSKIFNPVYLFDITFLPCEAYCT